MITGNPLHKYTSGYTRNEFTARCHEALLHKHGCIVLCTQRYFLITFFPTSDARHYNYKICLH